MIFRSIPLIAAATLVAFPAVVPVHAQEPAHVASGNQFVWVQRGGDDALPARAQFVATEMAFDGEPVKGAPYSAEAVTETVQTLSDGNRIVNTSRASVYRDSEGRTRREQTLGAVGPWAASPEGGRMVTINDPVAGVHYILSPETKTARKLPAPTVLVRKAGNAPADVIVERAPEGANKRVEHTQKVIVEATVGDGGPAVARRMPLPPMAVAGGAAAQGFRVELAEPKDAKKESLGTQTIEGVAAEGTRTTVTIPAGQIGNELPIEIVTEKWYSPDLQTVVMSRFSDPRFGETTYRLTNITRAEPARSLFEVPADFKVEDLGQNMRFRVQTLPGQHEE